MRNGESKPSDAAEKRRAESECNFDAAQQQCQRKAGASFSAEGNDHHTIFKARSSCTPCENAEDDRVDTGTFCHAGIR